MQLSKKISNMWKNIEKLKLSQHKEEQTVWCQNQVIILQSFHRKFDVGYRSEKPLLLLNKTVYLGLSRLESSERLMYEF